MTDISEQDRRRTLGAFVRAQRERHAPESLGLPSGVRRRTPGLRREEVAQLSGLSTTWYAWLEQGREIALSPAALARLARALRLDRAQRAYLFELAGRLDPERGSAQASAAVPRGALAAVDAIACPAYLLDRSWTALRWNPAAAHLFAGWLDRPADAGGTHNLLRFIFLNPAARTLIRDYDDRAARVAAEFHAEASLHLADPALRTLVEDLRASSRDFARLWEAHGVSGRQGGRRLFDHPQDGPLAYEQVSFNLAQQPDLKLTMLVPAAPDPDTGTGR
ncbi:MAG: helix-turn-helix transcriptional regulator [Sneathiellaceae bacterium]